MSTQAPNYPVHRSARSAADATFPVGSQNPLNPHHLNAQAHINNYQTAAFNAQPTTPPRTPQRAQPSRPAHNAHASYTNQESASKTKPKGNKHRPKNVSTSPAVQNIDRSKVSPPLTGQSTMPSSARRISTPSTAAYAGPTFHASPAPSALPIPSFYSKSVPVSTGMEAIFKSRKPEPSSETEASPTIRPSLPTSKLASGDTGREESPLDFIFNAHRQESARASSASSSANTLSNGPFDPPALSPQTGNVTPTASKHRDSRGPNSARNMFTMELDGGSTPGTPIGPAFSTPYSERMNAARSGRKKGTSPEPNANASPSLDRSQALKDFLFAQKPQEPSSSTLSFADLPKVPGAGGNHFSATPLRAYQNTYQRHADNGPNTIPRTGNRSSGLRREVEITPTKTPIEINQYNDNPSQNSITPSRSSHGPHPVYGFENQQFAGSVGRTPASPYSTPLAGQGSDLRGMEDSLRRMLKLEPSNSSGAPGAGIGSMPAASASVPAYIGGRDPPLNGLHNGVMGS